MGFILRRSCRYPTDAKDGFGSGFSQCRRNFPKLLTAEFAERLERLRLGVQLHPPCTITTSTPIDLRRPGFADH